RRRLRTGAGAVQPGGAGAALARRGGDQWLESAVRRVSPAAGPAALSWGKRRTGVMNRSWKKPTIQREPSGRLSLHLALLRFRLPAQRLHQVSQQAREFARHQREVRVEALGRIGAL